MSDRFPVDDVRSAAARLGGLSSYGRTPDRSDEREARRSLATARLDREVRDMAAKGIALDGPRAAHVVGLLLSSCGVKYDAGTLVEKLVRDAVDDTAQQ